MRMAPLDIVDGSYADEDKSFSAQDTVNYLPTSAEQAGTRTPTMLRTPPGLKPFSLIGTNSGGTMTVAGPVRGTYNAEGRFFAVAGQTLYQITTAGVSVPIGTIPGVGRVSFSHNQITNGNEVLINNGNSGYIYNTLTQVFERITDTSYPGGLKAVFINNRFVQIEPKRRYAFPSALANGLQYDALDRFTSETSPDLMMSIEAFGNQLMVFSASTAELFDDTGASPQPFRSSGMVSDKGTAGPYCTAKMDNALFSLGDDGVFYRYNGINPIRISTKPIEQSIRGKNWFNAFTTVWEDSGHSVCYWTFPDGMTWGYDASSGKWHRRESYELTRWRANSLTFWQNRWYAGDFQNGRLWELDWDYILEGEEEFTSIRCAGVVSDNQNRTIHERLEVVMNTGMEETVSPNPLFPSQPEGPVISGTPPDGVIGEPYSFTYTLTPGGNPIVKTTIDESALIEGLSWSQSTATISGIPADTGRMTLVVRTVDSAGMFFEKTDVVDISLVMMALANISSLGGSVTTASSSNDWENAWSQGTSMAASVGIIAAEGRRFICHSSQNTRRPIYTDNYGGSWIQGAGDNQVSVGGPRIGSCHPGSGVVLIPQGLSSGVLRSIDNGESWVKVGTHTANGCMPAGGLWISVSVYSSNMSYSEDDGTSWNIGGEVTNFAFPAGFSLFHLDGNVFIGGTSAAQTAPRLVSTVDGISYVDEDLPLVSGNKIVSICGGAGTMIAMTESGEILFKNETGWHISATQFEAIPKGITFNGSNFSAIGGDSGNMDDNIIIITSHDGDTWTVRKTTSISPSDSATGIAS